MQIVYAFRQGIETINSIWIAYLFDWVYSFFVVQRKFISCYANAVQNSIQTKQYMSQLQTL